MDIVASMLKNSKSGASRSHLMHLAFLTHRQLLEYLAYLQKHKLIEVDEKTRYIYPTEKGHLWLLAYERLMELTSDIIEDEIKGTLKQVKEWSKKNNLLLSPKDVSKVSNSRAKSGDKKAA